MSDKIKAFMEIEFLKSLSYETINEIMNKFHNENKDLKKEVLELEAWIANIKKEND